MKKNKILLLALLSALTLCGCGNNEEDTPKHDERIEAVYRAYKENGGTLDYDTWLQSIKGEKGDIGPQGPKGTDGLTPTIGENGHWYIGTTDTGVTAKGSDGTSPTITIDPVSFHWIINGQDSGVTAKGADAITPTIGENGHWYIGTTDTGVTAKGSDGTSPTITIDPVSFHWIINGQDSGVTAKGNDGQQGPRGNQVISMPGVPEANTGIVGDSYIDLLTFNFYVKDNDGWSYVGCLQPNGGKPYIVDFDNTVTIGRFGRPTLITRLEYSNGEIEYSKVALPNDIKYTNLIPVTDTLFASPDREPYLQFKTSPYDRYPINIKVSEFDWISDPNFYKQASETTKCISVEFCGANVTWGINVVEPSEDAVSNFSVYKSLDFDIPDYSSYYYYYDSDTMCQMLYETKLEDIQNIYDYKNAFDGDQVILFKDIFGFEKFNDVVAPAYLCDIHNKKTGGIDFLYIFFNLGDSAFNVGFWPNFVGTDDIENDYKRYLLEFINNCNYDFVYTTNYNKKETYISDITLDDIGPGKLIDVNRRDLLSLGSTIYFDTTIMQEGKPLHLNQAGCLQTSNHHPFTKQIFDEGLAVIEGTYDYTPGNCNFDIVTIPNDPGIVYGRKYYEGESIEESAFVLLDYDAERHLFKEHNTSSVLCAVDEENKVIDYYEPTESDLESKWTDTYSNTSFAFLDITEDNVEGEHIVAVKEDGDEFYYCLNSYIYKSGNTYCLNISENYYTGFFTKVGGKISWEHL